MARLEYQLGIDFGTSNTVATIGTLDASVRHLLIEATPLMPSAVFAQPSEYYALLTGADAERAAFAHPAGLEPNPKRRIDDGAVWLSQREYPVGDLIAAVLARVSVEAQRVTGHSPGRAVLTHPAGWGSVRLGVLAEAATRAGLPDVEFVPEPVAAATYFSTTAGGQVARDGCLVVYDLGAGTFDVAVVCPTRDGFKVAAFDGLDDVGGLDFDADVVMFARDLTKDAVESWERLEEPTISEDHHARRALWQGARAAKEQLSRHSAADLHVPLVQADLHLTRDEFERLIQPYVERTVALTRSTLRHAGISLHRVAGVILVGGSSRVPLIATAVHTVFGIAPTITDQPELVVAEGCLLACGPTKRATGAASVQEPDAQPPTDQPATVRLSAMDPPSADRQPQIRRRTIVKAAIASVAAGAVISWPKPRPRKVVGLRVDVAPSVVLDGHTRPVNSVVFSRVGNTLASGGDDHKVWLWNLASSQPTGTALTGHTNAVNCLAARPNSNRIASGGLDNTIRVWDTDRATSIGTPLDPGSYPVAHHKGIYSLAFTSDGNTLVSGGWCEMMSSEVVQPRGYDESRWPVRPGSWVFQQHDEVGDVTSIAFGANDRVMAYGSDRRRTYLYDFLDQRTMLTVLHGDEVLAVAFHPDGRTVASAGLDGTIRFIDPQNPANIQTFAANAGPICGMAYSPDGRLLVTGGKDKTIRVWDAANRLPACDPLTGHTDTITSVAFSPDGTMIASGGADRTVRLWRLGTG